MGIALIGIILLGSVIGWGVGKGLDKATSVPHVAEIHGSTDAAK